jgi:hypothetical protein
VKSKAKYEIENEYIEIQKIKLEEREEELRECERRGIR